MEVVCATQRSASETGQGFQIRAVSNQQFGHFDMSFCCRPVKRRVAALIAGIDLSTLFKQQLCSVHLAVVRGPMKRSVSGVGARVDVGSVGQQEGGDFSLIIVSGDVESRESVRIAEVYMCTVLEKQSRALH